VNLQDDQTPSPETADDSATTRAVRPLRAALSELLSNGEAWRFKDLAARLRNEAPESDVYKELRSLIRAGSVRRVRHGVYLAIGPYDWSAPVEAESGVPVIQSALYSQLHRLRTVDELRTLLGLPREVVWRSLRALIQSGAVCTGEPLGVFREMTFIRRDQLNASQPAAVSEEESVDRAILDVVEDGRLYSAHAVAAHVDIVVRAIKLSLRKLATVGVVRCFAFDDGMYFYLTGPVLVRGTSGGEESAEQAAASEPARKVKSVDVYAELGAVNVATLNVIESAEEGITALDVGTRLEDVFRGSRNTAARIITKLRRSGLVQLRATESASASIWEATDIGADVMAIARGSAIPAAPASAPEVLYEVREAEDQTAYRRLAQWMLDTMTARNGTVRRRIPVNKRILARSLNITKAHLDRCFRLLAPAGVSIEGWDIVISDVEALRAVLHEDG
jgi:hypothetical protein